MSNCRSLPLALLVLDSDVQPRETMSSGAIKEYAALYKEGHTLAPIVVFTEDDTYWVADGFHRVSAAKDAGLREIDADVRQGSKREAIFYACGSNTHGKARTNADKRRVVTRLLQDPEWSNLGAREIGRHCGVSDRFVGNVRKELFPSANGSQIATPRRVTRNGTTYLQADRVSVIPSDPSEPASVSSPAPASSPEAALPVDDGTEEEDVLIEGDEGADEETVPCRVCGASILASPYWHCDGCRQHWPLTRTPCPVCGYQPPFECLTSLSPALLLREPETIPVCVTVGPGVDYTAIERASAQAETSGEEALAEEENIAEDDISREEIEMRFPVVPQPAPPPLILVPDQPVPSGKRATFNRTNEMVDWAKWSWNPVTGCLHNCVYCYARDIAERFYTQKFVPTFHPDRLSAPYWTSLPKEAATDQTYRNVFVCSMADLFGKWVPQEWIDAVLQAVRDAPQWTFLFLTKFPQRLSSIDWPENAWVGTTVDEQYRVPIAEKAFAEVQASVKWLSCEPLRERLTFTSLTMFDWLVIGGQSVSSQAPAFQPPWEWVEHLWHQGREAELAIYWKENLLVRPKETPWEMGVLAPGAPGVHNQPTSSL